MLLPERDKKTLVISREFFFKEPFSLFQSVSFADLCSYRESDEHYDQIVLFLCMEYIREPRSFLFDMRDLLADHGELIVVSVNPDSKWKDVMQKADGLYFINRDFLLSLFRKHIDIVRGLLYIAPDCSDEKFSFKNENLHSKENLPGLFFSKWTFDKEHKKG